MDTSKEFILMCSKSKEIQELKPDKSDSSGQIFICEICGDTYTEDNGINFCYTHIEKSKNPIWLPRQDQLQKMIINFGHGHQNSGILTHLGLFSMKYKYDDKSMEQLWLAFIMWEKYSKQWDKDKEEWKN